jgi:hypothetical protein
MKALPLLLGLAALGLSPLAHSWGDLGHAAVGQLAQNRLTDKARGFLASFMGHEPLAVSATWPDHVRADDRFTPFGPYHFIEIRGPFKASDIGNLKRAPQDALTVLEKAPQLLVDSKLSSTDKALLLSYYVHIVGDVHQPLHVGNGFDRGGNLCDVKVVDPRTQRIERTNLHSAWDNALFENLKVEVERHYRKQGTPVGYFQYAHLAGFLERSFPETQDWKDAAKLPPANWFEESLALHKQVYPDEGKNVAPQDRAYCHVDRKKFRKKKVPTLRGAYVKNSVEIIKRRLFIAGLRLAEGLNSMAEKSSAKALSKAEEAEALSKLLLKN